MPCRRRRSPRHGRRAGWPGRWRESDANFSKSNGAASSSGMRAARMYGRAPLPVAAQALLRASRRRGTAASRRAPGRRPRRTLSRRLVDEQQHRRDEGRQAAGQFGGALAASTKRGLLAYSTKPTASAPACDGRIHVLLARQAADLDAGAVRRGLHALMAANHTQRVRCGRPQCGVVDRARGNTGRRARRSARPRRGLRAASTSRIHSRRLLALADHQQAAHDVADHVVQEGVGLELEAPVGAAARDVDAAQRLHRATWPGRPTRGTR